MEFHYLYISRSYVGMKFALYMSMTDYISLTDAKNILDMLSQEFKVKPCSVKYHRNIKNRGYACYVSRKIVISMYTDNWIHEDILLHEFSHILSYDRYGSKGIGHKEYFRLTLMDVVTAWYKDVNRYNWSHEYVSIKKWYSKLNTKKDGDI